jgi:hypothetical protein
VHEKSPSDVRPLGFIGTQTPGGDLRTPGTCDFEYSVFPSHRQFALLLKQTHCRRVISVGIRRPQASRRFAAPRKHGPDLRRARPQSVVQPHRACRGWQVTNQLAHIGERLERHHRGDDKLPRQWARLIQALTHGWPNPGAAECLSRLTAGPSAPWQCSPR